MTMITDKCELYIHIPFCVKKCLYCDFLSFPADEPAKERYIEALCDELIAIGNDRCNKSLISVFIGGGTPSVLPAEMLEKVMNTVKKNFTLDSDAEITIECNPGTVNEEKLAVYRSCGINRISFGLQSVHDDELKKLGRIHTYAEFEASYKAAVKAGFENINVDLMSDIPGQTLKSWEETLRKVCTLNPAPTHISAYSLIVEEGTPFAEMFAEGTLIVPGEEEDREMYHMTSKILKEYGYERYEISNYAKPGFSCRHNIGYWTGTEYFGAGLDAASYYGKCRYLDTDDYDSYVREPYAEPALTERLKKEDLMSEFMILGLRLTEGVDKEEFKLRFHEEMDEIYGKQIKKFMDEGLLETEDKKVRLTSRGLDLANVVMQSFI